MSRLVLSRRTLLRGLGAAIALPMLEAMLPLGTRGNLFASEIEAPPRRLVFYYVPNGIHMSAWRPAQSGAVWSPSTILEPITALQPKMTVISGLANRNAVDSVAGDHARGTGAFLTARLPRRSDGEDIAAGVSVDQLAAEAIGTQTPFASLQFGMEGGTSVGDCDSGYSCAYSRNISWASETTPMPKMTSPAVIFDRLFGGADPALSQVELARRRQNRMSLLDYAAEETTRIRGLLGASDQAKLDEYLTAIRSVETQLESLDQATACGDLTLPENPSVDLEAYSRAMNELMAMALSCDLTRVVSFMFGNGGSNRTFPNLGIADAHHQVSHHQDLVENFDKLAQIDRFEVAQFAHLAGLLDATVEPDGSTLLDHTAALFSSEISDGNRHNHDDLPVLLAGALGGAIAPGRHLVTAGEQPIANLYVSLLQGVGLDVSAFGGDGTGPLDGLAG